MIERLIRTFETYIGTTSSLRSRFELSYLVQIQKVVLVECLAVLRRADYSIENGFPTSVGVSVDSIVMTMMKRASGELSVSDISDWASIESRSVLACVDEEQWVEVLRPRDFYMTFFDDVLSNLTREMFWENEIAPRYTKPEFLYYNPLADRPAEFHGHKIVYFKS